ncbi:MAG: substrate-binding domain-containing protein [Bacillota bacterium]
MKKKISILLIVTLALTLFSSMAFAGWFGSDDDADDGKIKIGFLLKTMQEERYKKDRRYFTEEAESLGAEVVFDSANNSSSSQMSKFENMLSRGVDVIVLQPVNTGTAGSMVEKAHEEGVKVVGYDSMIQDGPLDVHVMQDSWAVGTLQGKEMVKWFKENKGEVEGNVALIKGQPGDSNAQYMSSGAKEIIEEHDGLDLIVEQSHEGWSPDDAMATAENALNKYDNNVDAFICNNSGMARGVISALESQDLDDTSKVFVAGSDADQTNIRYVEQGKQTVEIFKKIKPLSKTAAQIAFKLANNPDKEVKKAVEADIDRMIDNGHQEVPTIVTPIVTVTQDNIRDTVIEAGFHSEEDIFE